MKKPENDLSSYSCKPTICPLVEMIELLLKFEEESKSQPKKEPWDGKPRVTDRTGRVVML